MIERNNHGRNEAPPTSAGGGADDRDGQNSLGKSTAGFVVGLSGDRLNFQLSGPERDGKANDFKAL
jgi:hypothetical protein